MIVEHQLGLFKFDPEHPDVTWLKEHLKAKGWQTRRQLCAVLELPGTDSNLRRIRALVEAAGADVVKGQHGFNFVDNVTIEDLNHAAVQSIAQGKCMLRYGIALRRRAHAKVG
jgi:hypothetical protein